MYNNTYQILTYVSRFSFHRYQCVKWEYCLRCCLLLYCYTSSFLLLFWGFCLCWIHLHHIQSVNQHYWLFLKYHSALIFCLSTNSHSNKIVAVSKYTNLNLVIFNVVAQSEHCWRAFENIMMYIVHRDIASIKIQKKSYYSKAPPSDSSSWLYMDKTRSF